MRFEIEFVKSIGIDMPGADRTYRLSDGKRGMIYGIPYDYIDFDTLDELLEFVKGKPDFSAVQLSYDDDTPRLEVICDGC